MTGPALAHNSGDNDDDSDVDSTTPGRALFRQISTGTSEAEIMMMSGNNGYTAAEQAIGTAFSIELRAAIRASGLGLDRIQDRLRKRGISVSVTALSYWQSGKRQPERARSISAIHALEEILDRPAGSLVRLLQPPRPRGHAARRENASAHRQPPPAALPSAASKHGSPAP